MLLAFLPFSEWGLHWICEDTEYLQVLDLRMGAIIGLSFGEGLRIWYMMEHYYFIAYLSQFKHTCLVKQTKN